MTKNSEIDSTLLGDALVDVVDDVRRSIHGALGTRPWDVTIVTRRWSGDVAGVGTPSMNFLTLDPPPKVQRVTKDRMGPAGRESAGQVTMTNVSLRYSLDELQPSGGARVEYAYRLTDAHGQRSRTRWFVLSAEPVQRRGDKEGDETDWYILLNETAAMGNFDGVDAP